MSCFCKEKIDQCIKELEEEVMLILNNTKLDKYEKNLLLKPLSSKKKILTNAIDSLTLVESETIKDR